MNVQGRMSVLLVFAPVLIAACSAVQLPPNTRTGKVADIVITEAGTAPLDVEVSMGDEVRFRNERTKTSYVFFFRDFRDELSCEQGFKPYWGTEEGAKIAPGDSASLCFNRSGTIGYRVQFDYTSFGGIGGTPGEISVPSGQHGAIVVK
jgi:plastocyanin